MKDKGKTREQLIDELQDLRQRVSDLQASEAQLKDTKKKLNKQTHQLGERIKELDCLFGISQVLGKHDTSVHEILQGIVELLPPAFQYPEITASRLTLDDETFTAGNYQDTAWKQTEDIIVQGERIGSLEVCYLEERPKRYKGPFLKQEIGILHAITIGLGRLLERKRAEEALQESEEKYQLLAESLLDAVYEFDLEGKFTYVNKASTNMFGYSKDETLSGLRVEDTIVEEDKPLSRKAIKDILTGKPLWEKEHFSVRMGQGLLERFTPVPSIRGKMLLG